MATITLKVESFTNNTSDCTTCAGGDATGASWYVLGDYPYVDAIDASEIAAHHLACCATVEFENYVPASLSVNSITLKVHDQVNAGNQYCIWIYDGTSWTFVGTVTGKGWSTHDYDVSAILDTTAKINAAKVAVGAKFRGVSHLKKIDYIALEIDYTPLDFSNGTGVITDEDNVNTLYMTPISWKESQECDVAIRPVPLRSGPKVDTSHWMLDTREITFRVRLSDAEKTLLQTIFDAGENMWMFMSTGWRYYGWLRGKLVKYEYRVVNGTLRPWLYELRLDCITFSYNP